MTFTRHHLCGLTMLLAGMGLHFGQVSPVSTLDAETAIRAINDPINIPPHRERGTEPDVGEMLSDLGVSGLDDLTPLEQTPFDISEDTFAIEENPSPAGVAQDEPAPQDAAPVGLKADWPTVTFTFAENCGPCRELKAMLDDPRVVAQLASWNVAFVQQDDFAGGVPRMKFEAPETYGERGQSFTYKGKPRTVRALAKLLNQRWHQVHERSVVTKRASYPVRARSTWWSHKQEPDIRKHLMRDHGIASERIQNASIAELESLHSDLHERNESVRMQNGRARRWRVFR